MAIAASNPTTLAGTFDSWAIADFRIFGDGLADYAGPAVTPPVSVQARLVKYRTRPDGAHERSPLPGDVASLFVPDLYALAATDPTVAQALGALVAAVVAIGQDQGKL